MQQDLTPVLEQHLAEVKELAGDNWHGGRAGNQRDATVREFFAAALVAYEPCPASAPRQF